MPHRALIIEDDVAGQHPLFSDTLDLCNIAVVHRRSWRDATPVNVIRHRADLIVVKAAAPTAEAIELFTWLRGHPVHAATLGILPAGDAAFLRLAAEAVDEFLLSPVNPEEFRHRTFRLLGPPPDERTSLKDRLLGELAFQNIVGKEATFLAMLSRVAQFARSDAPVLLSGETGTGKELCARAIHMLSTRRNGPFIPVECGSLPESLFENELFGHSRGAYTGAHADQKGLVALAHGGTLFLDEVDGLTPPAQGKLLRLLQESTFRPLGSERLTQADVRIVAASNADLSPLVEDKRFRADLFFRLNVLRIELPPLRRRPADIALLARRFTDDLCSSQGVPRKTFSLPAMRKLESYHWPGNVRELYNTVQRAVLTTSGGELLPAQLEIGPAGATPEPPADFRSGRARAIESFEAEYVQRLLSKHNGNVTRAARDAGKERRAFGRLVKKYCA